MNRWEEYRAGTLTPPAVVQHDHLPNEHLVWIWDGEKVRGAFYREEYDEAAILADVQAMIAAELAEQEAREELDQQGGQ
jgi:hypothetical protein